VEKVEQQMMVQDDVDAIDGAIGVRVMEVTLGTHPNPLS
jgi:hypothetical protein